MLRLWQILPLSLEHVIEHLSGIGPATNEGIVQEGAESEVRIPCETGLRYGLLVEDVWVDERGYRWGKLPENDAGSPRAVERAVPRAPHR
jgi:hypothetical protein